MISANSLSVIVFVALLCLFLYFKRSKVALQKPLFPLVYVIMYRSSFGIRAMDSISRKLPVVLRLFGYAGVFFGFVGMVIICFALAQSAYKLFFVPAAAAGVALVLPVKAKGVFFVPFVYWIISIFVLAVIHEAAHGVMARLYNVNIKSAGFAFFSIFLPVVPAAFVEPDEKQLKKRRDGQQLSVFAAGPFANILFGLAVMGVLFLAMPAAAGMVNPGGVVITGFDEGSVAKGAGLSVGEKVIAIDNLSSASLGEFTYYLSSKHPGDSIALKTNMSSYEVVLAAHPDNSSRPFLGVYVAQDSSIRRDVNPLLVSVVFWVLGLMYWLYILNIGIGLFNLVPIGPLDGGRMVQLVAHKVFGIVRGNRAWKAVSLFFFVLVAANIIFSFLK